MTVIRLICPLEAESGVLGGPPSLANRIWHLLAQQPGGLPLEGISTALGPDNGCGKAEDVLAVSKYFVQTEAGEWDLAVRQPLRWGVAGCGKLAEDFAGVLSTVPGAVLAAAAEEYDAVWRALPNRELTNGMSPYDGLSSLERAQAFATSRGIPKAYGTYAELAADPEVRVLHRFAPDSPMTCTDAAANAILTALRARCQVDVVHVAMVHPGHHETALKMIAAGKHVMVEKCFAMNEREATEMIDAAREKGVFMMEALWGRFCPAQQALRALIRCGAIGEPLQGDARCAFEADFVRSPGLCQLFDRRLIDPALGGGALLDVGIYPISLLAWAFGHREPTEVKAMAVMHPGGTPDVAGSVQLRFGKNVLGQAQWSFLQLSPRVAHIYGTKGSITTERTNCPERLTLKCYSGETKVFDFPHPQDIPGIDHGPADGGFHFPGSSGLAYEAAAVHSAIVKGWKEMDDMPLEETLAMARCLDEIRRQVKLIYPQDTKTG